MRYKSLLYLRAGLYLRVHLLGAVVCSAESRKLGCRGQKERESKGFGWLRGVNANLKIPPSPFSLLHPSWFPGANDTFSFINGDRVAALDLICACIQKRGCKNR